MFVENGDDKASFYKYNIGHMVPKEKKMIKTFVENGDGNRIEFGLVLVGVFFAVRKPSIGHMGPKAHL